MTDEEQHKVETNNIKIAITAVVSVLFCAAFLLALINFGMGMQQKIDKEAEERRKKDEIVSIITVDYSTKTFKYQVPANTEEDSSEAPKNYLISSVKDDYDENYLIIDNNDTLKAVIDELRSTTGDSSINFELDDSFFDSSSVILLTSEKANLTDLQINGLTRDADYNVQIDAKTKTSDDSNSDTKNGVAAIITVRNIQPESVTVNMDK